MRNRGRIKTPSKRRMTAELIKLCRMAWTRLPVDCRPTQATFADGTEIVSVYQDDSVIIIYGPGHATFSVRRRRRNLRDSSASAILVVIRGELVHSWPSKPIIDHLHRIMILDQLARG